MIKTVIYYACGFCIIEGLIFYGGEAAEDGPKNFAGSKAARGGVQKFDCEASITLFFNFIKFTSSQIEKYAK